MHHEAARGGHLGARSPPPSRPAPRTDAATSPCSLPTRPRPSRHPANRRPGRCSVRTCGRNCSTTSPTLDGRLGRQQQKPAHEHLPCMVESAVDTIRNTCRVNRTPDRPRRVDRPYPHERTEGERMLRLAYVGGLGLMAGPAGTHLKSEGPAQVLRVHDRGTPGQQRDAFREGWRQHGAELVGTFRGRHRRRPTRRCGGVLR